MPDPLISETNRSETAAQPATGTAQATGGGASALPPAAVTLPSTRTWMVVLGLFWAILAAFLLTALFATWPPPAAPPSISVYPSVATLSPNTTLQFLSSATGGGPEAVVWTATEGQITPSGVFTAPAKDSGKPIRITATRESDRTQTASAEVNIHEKKLVMDQSVVDGGFMRSGDKIEFHALGPDGAENGLHWYLSGSGVLADSGSYTIRDKTAAQAIVTAIDPAGGRKAAAVVKLAAGPKAVDGKPLLLLVVIMGAFGALLGAMRSFVNYVGTRAFVPSWGLFYLSRPVFGAGLALIVFFAYRIGAITGPAQNATPADPFAAACIAGMVGLFADTVLQKLHELVDQLFRPADRRPDKMGSAAVNPTISTLVVDQGVLTVTGTNFVQGASVSVNGTVLQPTTVTATALKVTLPAALSAKGTKLEVFVTNPDGGKSSVMTVDNLAAAASK